MDFTILFNNLQIQNRFKPLIAHLRYLPGGKLDIANRLYVSKKTHLHKPFVEQARDIFASGVTKIDFQYPTFAAEEINSWVNRFEYLATKVRDRSSSEARTL